jgi:hypothetical protein
MQEEERRQILKMLAGKKINAEEADKLLKVIDEKQAEETGEESPQPVKNPKSLIIVIKKNQSQPGKERTINVKVPLFMIKAGVKLASFLPGGAENAISKALDKHKLKINSDTFLPENFKEIISIMEEMIITLDEEDMTIRFRFE